MLMTILPDPFSTSVMFVPFIIVNFKRLVSTISLLTVKLNGKHTSVAPTSNVSEITVVKPSSEFSEPTSSNC